MNADDSETVQSLLGRTPQAAFEIAVEDEFGAPVVIRNAPFCYDGTPMPTRYWLVGKHEIEVIGHIESAGGVNQAEHDVDADALLASHARYAADRDRAVETEHIGPLPTGGVGGTRQGVKCLHAHYAWWLVDGADPVGEWTKARIDAAGETMSKYRLVGV